jgi:hypothetical protein
MLSFFGAFVRAPIYRIRIGSQRPIQQVGHFAVAGLLVLLKSVDPLAVQ